MRLLSTCLLLCLLTCCVPGFAQTQASSWQQTFEAKNYAGFLAELPAVLNGAAVKPAPAYDRIAMTAVALQKTNGWQTPAGARARELLNASPDALRYLDETHKLLEGDVEALARLYNKKSYPDTLAAVGAMRAMRSAGYAMASNCLQVVGPLDPIGQISAMMTLPRDKRRLLVPALDVRFTNGWPDRQDFARLATSYCFNPPPQLANCDSQELLELAWFITGGMPTLATIFSNQLAQAGKFAESTQIARALAERNPTNAELLYICATRIQQNGHYADSALIYLKGMKSVPSPDVRALRVQYVGYLNLMKEKEKSYDGMEDSLELQKSQDPLLAADAYLVNNALADAAKLYARVLNDKAEPLPRRLDAWTGLLDADPETALNAGESLLDAIGTLPSEERTPRTVWLGVYLWRVVAREVDYLKMRKGTPYGAAQPPAVRPLHDARGWEEKVANIFDRVLLMEPVNGYIGHPEVKIDMDMRTVAVAVFLLANQQQKALDALTHEVEIPIMPPELYYMYDGKVPLDIQRKFMKKLPSPDSFPYLFKSLNENMGDYPEFKARLRALEEKAPRGKTPAVHTGTGNLPPARTAFTAEDKTRLQEKLTAVQGKWGEIKGSKDNTAFLQGARALFQQFHDALLILDYSRGWPQNMKPVPIEMALYTPFEAVMKEFCADPRISGIQLALMSASEMLEVTDVRLLDPLYALTVQVIENSGAQPANSAALKANCAQVVAGMLDRTDRDVLKPYAARLREKYPIIKAPPATTQPTTQPPATTPTETKPPAVPQPGTPQERLQALLKKMEEQRPLLEKVLDPKVFLPASKELADAFIEACKLIDPMTPSDAPHKPADMAAYQPFDTLMRSMLLIANVQHTNALDAPARAMCQVTDPPLLEALLTLQMFGIDKCPASDTNLADMRCMKAYSCANILNKSKREDLKPYAARLREKYPMP